MRYWEKERIERAGRKLTRWHQVHIPTSRLERHEMYKAFLVEQWGYGCRLEVRRDVNNKRSLIDFISDENLAIEIDDGPSKKSINKLVELRDEHGYDVVWVIHLTKGKGGKSLRTAEAAGIPLLRIYPHIDQMEWSL